MNLAARFLPFLVFALAPLFAKADLIVTIGQATDTGSTTDVDTPIGPFMAGDSVSIDFLAHLDGGTVPANPLTSYSFLFDVGGISGGDGTGVGFAGSPDFFDNFSFASGIGGTLATQPIAGGVLPVDFSVSWSGNAPISTDASMPSTLFTMTFDTSAATTAGIYDIVHFPSLLDQGSGGGGNFLAANMQFDNGQFQITAVPEPSSALLLAVGCGLAAVRQRRRRKRQSPRHAA